MVGPVPDPVPVPGLKTPHWSWPITLDFFVSGTAAGAYLTATVALLAGAGRYHAIVGAGYLLAFPLILLSLALLTFDLGLPGRFFHMLWSRKGPGAIGRATLTLGDFHLKALSPMSVGAWGLSVFSGFAFIALVQTWIAPGWGDRPVMIFIGILGAFFALFAGGYKGILLRATAQPVWSGSRWLGPLFLSAALSSGVAAVALLSRLLGADEEEVQRLGRALVVALVLEGVLLTVWLWDLGLERRRVVGPALWAGRMAGGFLLPLGALGAGLLDAAAPLALAGGLIFRYLVVAAAPQD